MAYMQCWLVYSGLALHTAHQVSAAVDDDHCRVK